MFLWHNIGYYFISKSDISKIQQQNSLPGELGPSDVEVENVDTFFGTVVADDAVDVSVVVSITYNFWVTRY